MKRYVLGRNPEASICLERVRIDRVVDDFASESDMWKGVPLVRADRLSENSIVVNCSTSVRPVSAHARLASIPGIQVLSYVDLVRADAALPFPDFVTEFRADYVSNEQKWRSLEARLADEASRLVLDALTGYRFTGDYRRMSGFSVRFAEQYFDEAVPLGDYEIFVDCGGFDGDTVLQFCARTGGHKHIYCFEPSPANFNKARERLAGVSNLSLIPLGVSDGKGSLCFDPNGGSASSVTLEGPISVEVVTIDEYIQDRISYIKMDLEGWELPALKGAKRHVAEDHPKLAIAVYHRASDFWQIPEYILSIQDDYQIYLRHYSEGWSESVMYFVPGDHSAV